MRWGRSAALISLLACLGEGPCVSALECAFEQEVDPSAAAFLTPDWLVDGMTSQVMRASFEQEKTIQALSRPLRSSGTLLITKGEGIAWRVERPFPTDYILTADQMIMDDRQGSRQTISIKKQPQMGHVSQAFMSLYAGDLQSLSKWFSVYDYKAGATGWEVGLKPREKSLERMLISMCIQGKGAFIHQVVMHEPLGDSTTITFTHHTLTPPALTEEERHVFAAP